MAKIILFGVDSIFQPVGFKEGCASIIYKFGNNIYYSLKRNKGKYRFLLLVPYTYPDYSGSGRNAFNFGKFLVKRNIPAKLVTFNRNLKYKKHEQLDGLVIERITYFNKNLFLKIISLLLWILPAYIFWILRNDVIYLFGSNLIAWQFVVLSGRLFRKKILFRSLIFGEDDIGSLLLRKVYITRIFNKFLFRQVDCYFSINPGFSLEYRKITNRSDRILEMPQGVDTDIFHPVSAENRKKLRKKLGFSEFGFIIVSVAFLISRKGFDEIFKQLNTLQIPFKYLIIGEYDFGKDHFLSSKKDETVSLRDKGLELLGSKLSITGPKENVNEYLQASDICLFNSQAEGLPNSMLEAMACGIPVVTNPITGLKGYLLHHEENSIVFEQIDEMNHWIERIYHNPEMKVGICKNAAETIKSMGTFDVVLNRMLNILKIEY